MRQPAQNRQETETARGIVKKTANAAPGAQAQDEKKKARNKPRANQPNPAKKGGKRGPNPKEEPQNRARAR
jgi:hypothetical protein